MTEDKNKDKDQNRGVENTDSEKEKEERKGVEEREGNVESNEVTAQRKNSEVVYERKEKCVREIQSEEEDKGGGPSEEMEKRIKYKHETIRKETIGREKVSIIDDKEIKNEFDLKKDKSWISDDKKMEDAELEREEGEKGYSNIKKEEKEQSGENGSREDDMKDKKNTEEDQTGTKKAKEKEISKERLKEVEEREHASLPLLKVPLQRSTLSDEKKEKEESDEDRRGEDINNEKNNDEDQTNKKTPGNMGISEARLEGPTDTKKTGKIRINEKRLEGIEERESTSLTLSKVPLQRLTLSDEKYEREELEEDRRVEDIKNVEGQTNITPPGNMGISEERLEGNEERGYASLPLPKVQSQRSLLSNEKEEKEEREKDGRGKDKKDKKNIEECKADTKKTVNKEISEEMPKGIEEREHASFPLIQRSTLSGEFERANPEFPVQEDMHQDVVQSDSTLDKIDQQSGRSENNSKKVYFGFGKLYLIS